MMINTNNLVSITEANQNFSKIARIVDEMGTVIVLKNNALRYVVLDYYQLTNEKVTEVDAVMFAAKQFLKKCSATFETISK